MYSYLYICILYIYFIECTVYYSCLDLHISIELWVVVSTPKLDRGLAKKGSKKFGEK